MLLCDVGNLLEVVPVLAMRAQGSDDGSQALRCKSQRIRKVLTGDASFVVSVCVEWRRPFNSSESFEV